MKIIAYGSREFGRLVRELVLHCEHEFFGFIDDAEPQGPGVLGDYESVRRRHPPAADLGVVMAIGYNNLEARFRRWLAVREDGYATPALVHHTAVVAPSAQIGQGAILMAAANVDSFTRVGDACVLWPGSIVSHDCDVGANSFLSPGSTLCGFVVTGQNCFFGAGSVVVDHRTLPAGSYVKAGRVHQ